MVSRIEKALIGLNAYIDNDREKLCDRIKGLEKSHKRMLRVFKLIKKELAYFPHEFSVSFVESLVDGEIERKVL